MVYDPFPLSWMSLGPHVHWSGGLQVKGGLRPGPHGLPCGSCGVTVTVGSPVVGSVVVVVGLDAGSTPTSHEQRLGHLAPRRASVLGHLHVEVKLVDAVDLAEAGDLLGPVEVVRELICRRRRCRSTCTARKSSSGCSGSRGRRPGPRARRRPSPTSRGRSASRKLPVPIVGESMVTVASTLS